MDSIQKDDELRGWIRSCRDLILDCIKNPERKVDDEINKLINQGRSISEKYRKDLNHLYSEGQQILTRIRTDPHLQDFSSKLEQLGRDLACNSRGQPDLFVLESSMLSIKELFVENARNMFVDLPLKKLEIEDDSMWLCLRGITMQGTGLIPEIIKVEMSSSSDFRLQKSSEAQTTFRLGMRIDKIKPQFKDVCFGYKKKTFPHTEDSGTFDMIFEGDGLCMDSYITIVLDSHKVSKAKLSKLSVSLDTISIKFGDTQHPILDWLAAPLISAQLRTRLERLIGDWIHRNLRTYICQLNDWFRTNPYQSMLTRGDVALKQAAQQ
jgi:hypothetical protein